MAKMYLFVATYLETTITIMRAYDQKTTTLLTYPQPVPINYNFILPQCDYDTEGDQLQDQIFT